MLKRNDVFRQLDESVKNNAVTAILGPRQSGKTTLARMFGKQHSSTYFDLENPADYTSLKNPMQSLGRLRGYVIIDEVQRMPELFSVLRVLSDRKPIPARFIILGSASPSLIRHSSESLAGRISFIHLCGFNLQEVGANSYDQLWLRGGFPRSFLAHSASQSILWRRDFVQTFLERDIPQLGFHLSAMTLHRFWSMLSHYHAQLWNGSEIGASLGVSHPTVRHYLDILTGAYVIRQLHPWHENISKRIVKSPKVFVRDSGLLHSFLNVASLRDLESHPKLGASWEGFVIEQILSIVGDQYAYFWRTQAGAELDLVILNRGKKWGFEIKYSDAPSITKSMRESMVDLDLAHLWVVYPGPKSYPLAHKIDCISILELSKVISSNF